MDPLCPFDFKPVTREGFTCDRHCYAAWLSFAEKLYRQADGLLIIPTDVSMPATLITQPWYLQEFPQDVKPIVED